MLKIAVLQRYKENKYGDFDYYVTEDNIKMFAGKDVFLYQVNNLVNIEEVVKECDGLFVPGGADIDPELYGEKISGTEEFHRFIDEVDYAYIDAFYKAEKPILGICRGQQIINVFFGGSLYQDIANHRNTWHDVDIEKDSFIYDIYHCERLKVNSWHHQAVKKLAPGFRVAARSNDGTIEALQYKNIYTTQWHPEMYDGDTFIEYFIKKVF